MTVRVVFYHFSSVYHNSNNLLPQQNSRIQNFWPFICTHSFHLILFALSQFWFTYSSFFSWLLSNDDYLNFFLYISIFIIFQKIIFFPIIPSRYCDMIVWILHLNFIFNFRVSSYFLHFLIFKFPFSIFLSFIFRFHIFQDNNESFKS